MYSNKTTKSVKLGRLGAAAVFGTMVSCACAVLIALTAKLIQAIL